MDDSLEKALRDRHRLGDTGGRDLFAKAELFDACGTGLGSLSHYPWYDPSTMVLPIKIDDDRISEMTGRLADGLAAAGMTFEGFRVHPVFTNEYNDDIDATENKSVTLFNRTATVLETVIESFPGDLLIFCDRQGARQHYTRLRAAAFPGSSFRIMVQNDKMSHYIVKWNGRRIEVVFSEKSDTKFMPVALASMMCKYVREMCMMQFNAFWQGEVPTVKATAGYPTDARRFLKEVDDVRQRLGISDQILIRKR